MGLFSRRNKEEPSPGERGSTDAAATVALPEGGRPVSSPLGTAERSRIAHGLEALRARAVDVDDLAALGAAYDRAFEAARSGVGETPADVVEQFGIAIGEYLARHSHRDWAVVTDVFGTDLGLVDARSDTVIVPHNLVSARWMRGETGWIPGVVGHLVSLRPRA
ncbi:DUF3806 domain-containing protein [Intrasporangium sp. DVR]|uniref:DUF3806 domain-containing protein n=1 Tax=Intrasporangium sp. DVR TaxID=3127867 RepID=UPI00313A680E